MFYRVFLLSATLIFTCCRSTKHQVTSTSSTEIYGTWIYKESSGGFSGQGTGWEHPVTLDLTKDRTYRIKHNQQILENDRFTLSRTVSGEDSVSVLDLEAGLDKRYRLSGDTLFLSELVNDGFSYVFLRQNTIKSF